MDKETALTIQQWVDGKVVPAFKDAVNEWILTKMKRLKTEGEDLGELVQEQESQLAQAKAKLSGLRQEYNSLAEDLASRTEPGSKPGAKFTDAERRALKKVK